MLLELIRETKRELLEREGALLQRTSLLERGRLIRERDAYYREGRLLERGRLIREREAY